MPSERDRAWRVSPTSVPADDVQWDTMKASVLQKHGPESIADGSLVTYCSTGETACDAFGQFHLPVLQLVMQIGCQRTRAKSGQGPSERNIRQRDGRGRPAPPQNNQASVLRPAMTSMLYRAASLASVTVIVALAGCTKPNAPTKANFRKAIEPLVHDAFCTPIKAPPISDEEAGTPVDRPAFPLVIRQKAGHGLSDDQSARDALDEAAKAGLLTREAKTMPLPPYPGSTDPKVSTAIVAYTPTEKGKDYFRGVASRTYGGDIRKFANLCLGDGKLDDIVRWTEPADALGMKFSTVTYQLSVTNYNARYAARPRR